MKIRMVLLVIVIAAFPLPADECWTIDQSEFIQYIPQAYGLRSKAPAQWGRYSSPEECEKARKATYRGDGVYDKWIGNSKCVRCGGSSAGSGVSTSPMETIVNAIVRLAFGPTRDTSAQDALAQQRAQEEARQAEEAARLEKEAVNAAGRKAFSDLQKSQAQIREEEAARKLGEKDRLLGNIGTIGGELTLKTIGTDFFGTGKPTDVRLQPRGGCYPIPEKFETLDLLRGAVYFMQNAVQASDPTIGDYEGARFLAEQAEKMIQRQPTDVPWRLESMPQAPAPPTPEQTKAKMEKLEILSSGFKEKVVSLRNIEIKITEIQTRTKEKESVKEAAQKKLKDAQEAAAVAKPESKSEADKLVDMLNADLQKAEDDLAKTKQAGDEQAKEAEKLKGDLKNIGMEIQKLNKWPNAAAEVGKL